MAPFVRPTNGALGVLRAAADRIGSRRRGRALSDAGFWQRVFANGGPLDAVDREHGAADGAADARGWPS